MDFGKRSCQTPSTTPQLYATATGARTQQFFPQEAAILQSIRLPQFFGSTTTGCHSLPGQSEARVYTQ